MKKPKVEFIEIVADASLKEKEKEATAAIRQICPDCGPVRLYRTSQGKIGFQLQISLEPGNRKLLDDVYRTVMGVLGHRRGRKAGERTVQTKLRLPEHDYASLKSLARETHSTMSHVVTNFLRARPHIRGEHHSTRSKRSSSG